eukprot:UN04767
MVSREEAEALVKKILEFVVYCETSALTQQGLRNCFAAAVRRAFDGKLQPFLDLPYKISEYVLVTYKRNTLDVHSDSNET